MKTQIINVPIVTKIQDNGDGGFSAYAFNNQDELIKDYEEDGPLTDDVLKMILDEEDPYNYGYLGSGQISLKVEILEDGSINISLAEPLWFHGGQ